MIKETIIVMTVLGCGDEIASCDYIKTTDKSWSNIEACNNAFPSAILMSKEASYPVITASCSEKITHEETMKTDETVQDIEPKVEMTMFNQLQAKAAETDIDLGNKLKNLYRTSKSNHITSHRQV